MIILDSKRPVGEGAPVSERASVEPVAETKKEDVVIDTPVEPSPAKVDEQINPDDIPF